MTDLLFSTDENARATALTGDFIERYSRTVAQRPVYPEIDRDALRALMGEPLPDAGRSVESLFAELEAVIVPNSTQPAHPRFLPYVQPSPNGLSPYAEAAAAALNQNCNLWTLSPAAGARRLQLRLLSPEGTRRCREPRGPEAPGRCRHRLSRPGVGEGPHWLARVLHEPANHQGGCRSHHGRDRPPGEGNGGSMIAMTSRRRHCAWPPAPGHAHR